MTKAEATGWPDWAVPALTTLFGLQLIRALVPYLVFLLGSRLRLSPFEYGGIGLLVFATAFLIPPLSRWLGLRRLLLGAAGGVALLRLLTQLWSGDPLVDAGLVVGGVVLFIFFWPAYLAWVQAQGDEPGRGQSVALAFLLGLCLDTTLHGVFYTYDVIWQAGAIPLWLTFGLVLLQAIALSRISEAVPTESIRIQESGWTALPWLALGPFLFLELVIFQNQARLAALTGWDLPLAFAWVLGSHLIGLTVAVRWQPRAIGAGAAGLLLLLALWPLAGIQPLAIALSLAAGQISLAVLISLVLRRLATRPINPNEGGRSPGHPAYGAGMLGLVILLFITYIPFLMPIPYNPDWISMVAGLLVGGCGLVAVYASPAPASRPARSLLLWPWALLLAPLLVWLAWPTPSPAAPVPPAGGLRIVNYNIQHGFGPAGQLDIEAVARTIEIQRPDIVALQEVGRGWVTNGSLDTFSWLSQRLDMPYAHYHPTSGGGLWGQAVISRYPLALAETYPLPPAGLPLERGFSYYRFDLGQLEPLQLINTHLHHLPWDGSVRLQQIETIVDFTMSLPFERLVLAGDFNAIPNAPEMQRLYGRGLHDVVFEAGLLPGYTHTSDRPTRQVDYILLSPDLAAVEVVIPHSPASDHLPVAATILTEP